MLAHVAIARARRRRHRHRHCSRTSPSPTDHRRPTATFSSSPSPSTATQMEPYSLHPCCCGKGDLLRMTSNSIRNRNRIYYCCPASKPGQKFWGCGYFSWEDEFRLCPCGQGPCIAKNRKGGVYYQCPKDGQKNCNYKEWVLDARAGTGSSSPRPSTGEKISSPGSAREKSSCLLVRECSGGRGANCPNCKLLSMEKKIVETKLDIVKHAEEHASQSSAAVYELLDELHELILK